MANVLIACNNADSVDLHNFLQSCADLARQQCVDFNHNYSFVEPPHLTEQEVISPMPYHQICLIAAHGDADGVYNENHEDVVTTRTINYNFEGKGFYSVSCLCAQNLRIELMRIGLKLFVGYNIPFCVGDDEDLFCECALEGFKSILNGNSKKVAHKAMLDKYDEVIKTASFEDKIKLLRNKEHLVFDGEDNLLLSDLI
jgi:hypothetical protein